MPRIVRMLLVLCLLVFLKAISSIFYFCFQSLKRFSRNQNSMPILRAK